MSSYKNLVGVFIKALSMGDPDKKKKRIFYKLAGIIIMCVVMIPCSVLVGAIVYGITSALTQLGGNTEGISLILYFISLFSIVFGINVILNVFYFSGDIEYLLPLPIKPAVLVSSKFTAAYLGENIMQVFIVLGAFIGYFLAADVSIAKILYAIVGVMTLPLLPMVYCGIACLLLMAFTSLFKNKETVNKITTVLLFAVIAVIIASFGFMQGVEIDEYILNMASGDNTFFNALNIALPNVWLLSESIGSGSIVSFLLYIAVNLVAVVVFVVLGHLLYFKGVVGLNVSKSKKNNDNFDAVIGKCKVKSQTISYFKKEIAILIRTPAFLTNCILINVIWPVFLYVIVMLQGKTNFLNSFIESYKNNENNARLWVVVGVILISLLVTATNSLGSSAVTREGKHIAFMKYIPIPYITQINIKAAVSIIISFIGVFIYIVIAAIYLNAGILNTLLYCLISLSAVIFVTYLGIHLDSVNPKLTWDDELSSLRENYNIFFNMGFAIIFTLLLCGGICLLYFLCNLSVLVLTFISLILLVICDIIIYSVAKTKTVKNIIEINC